MNCREAQRALEDAMDRDEPLGADIGGHLANCASCRAEFRRLQALTSSVAATTTCPEADEAVRRALDRALTRAAMRPRVGVAGRLAWAGLALLAFAIGFGARGLMPSPVPLRESGAQVRGGRVEVPVYRERVVERIVRVPVVRVRRVYLRAAGLQAAEGSASPSHHVTLPAPGETERPTVITERLPSPPPLPQVTYSESVRLARLVDEPSK